MAERILVADDERTVRAVFKKLLVSEGYEVVLAKDGEEAVKKFAEQRPSLVLLDVMMPKMNGMAACTQIRKIDPLAPVLFFTAMPSELSMLRAFGVGADDFISKDRSPEEFIARVKSALRRVSVAAELAGEKINLGRASIDFMKMGISVDSEHSSLTRAELLLLRLMLSEPGRVFSFDDIFKAIAGEGYLGDESSIRTLVCRLKNKLGKAAPAIVNVRGCGYKIEIKK